MSGPVEITVFPRLDCCVPDFTGKNRTLGRLLSVAQETLGRRARIQVVGTATRPERVRYYRGMVQALLAAGWTFPAPIDPVTLPLELPPALPPALRDLSLYLFAVAPVVAVAGKAVFVGEVPSLETLAEAVEEAERIEAGGAA